MCGLPVVDVLARLDVFVGMGTFVEGLFCVFTTWAAGVMRGSGGDVRGRTMRAFVVRRSAASLL